MNFLNINLHFNTDNGARTT